MKIANKLVLLFILMPLHQFILLIKKINECEPSIDDTDSPEVRLTSLRKKRLRGTGQARSAALGADNRRVG
jgi:hypothetical protein